MTENDIQKKWLETDSGKICYFINNSFAGRPFIIFLHGLSANHTTWISTANLLKKYRLNFIIPDLRGHGYSDKTKNPKLYKLSVFTDDVKKILEKETISESIFLGYSFGGQIALDYSTKYPNTVKALVLIGANHASPLIYGWLKPLNRVTYLLIRMIAWLFLWQKMKNYHYFEQGKSSGYWKSTFKGFSTMPISVNLWMLSEIANLDLRKEICNISCPTLIIKSDADQFISQAEMNDLKKNIKKSKLISLSGTSHFLATIFESKIAKIIDDFLVEEKII